MVQSDFGLRNESRREEKLKRGKEVNAALSRDFINGSGKEFHGLEKGILESKRS